MKLLNLLIEELSDFEQPEQTDAAKARSIQMKVKSLSHHKAILAPMEIQFEKMHDEGKMTPALRQKWEVVKAKLKSIEQQFKELNIKIGKNKIANPLAYCDLALYVGPPEQYPDLTYSQVKILEKLQMLLGMAGLQPLTLLYGGRRSHSYTGINFVAVNADNTFVWRKFDPGPRSGQNTVYFAGATKTSSVFNSKTKTREARVSTGAMKTSDFLINPGKFLTLNNPPSLNKKN